MKQLNYVRRCKNKTDTERHKILHVADNHKTLCGKELDEMWFIELSAGLNTEDVTCRKCRCIIARPFDRFIRTRRKV